MAEESAQAMAKASEEQRRDEAIRRALRRQALADRDALSQEKRRRAALSLTKRLLRHPWFDGSEIVLLYASFGSELSTWALMEETLRLGKALYLPRVTQDAAKARMEFYRVRALSELAAGYGNIPEPPAGREKYGGGPEEAAHTLVLMPGVAFDREKNRLGYGKGFYDGYLAKRQALRLRTVALGYRCQLMERIPAREGDVRPCQVLCF